MDKADKMEKNDKLLRLFRLHNNIRTSPREVILPFCDSELVTADPDINLALKRSFSKRERVAFCLTDKDLFNYVGQFVEGVCCDICSAVDTRTGIKFGVNRTTGVGILVSYSDGVFYGECFLKPFSIYYKQITYDAEVKRINTYLDKLASYMDNLPTYRLMYGADSLSYNLNLLFALGNMINSIDRVAMVKASTIKELNTLALVGLKMELEISRLDDKIAAKVGTYALEKQKEAYLREQLRAIQDELEDGLDESEFDYQIKIDMLSAPEKVINKLSNENRKLARLNPSSSDYFIIQNYIEFCLSLPWKINAPVKIDIEKARKILDADHYGMKEVKERILEFLAVRKLSGKAAGSIICLAGAPGVGKTSICKSIARAMGINYVRVSLGGIKDEAEIRGHRRTYVGAMSGKIIQGIKEAGQNNPLFLLDEIDKLTSDMRGDPASALLEALDPAQNDTFTDHYVDLPFDLSNTTFITTANNLDSIPAPLLDRMEVIEMNGYTVLEKKEIAKRHLIAKLKKKCSIKNKVTISDGALEMIIENYTKESGVRELERMIEKIMRKIAMDIVENETEKEEKASNKKRVYKIEKTNVEKYLGIARYENDNYNLQDSVGVVTGLAWTRVGGEVLNIEVSTQNGKGDFILTGQLGDVMKESARLALSYLKTNSESLGLDYNVFSTKDIHIHLPEGAVKKDGPSAGITLTAAMYSALSGRKARHELAMTGEISLMGKVLAIGGLKEKLLAATRGGIRTVLLPLQNKKDVVEMPEEIKQALDLIYVSDVSEVLKQVVI